MKFRPTSISALQIFQLMRFSTLFLIGIVFAKAGLSNMEIGRYETFLFIAGAVSFFWLNGLIQGFLPLGEKQDSGRTSNFFNVFLLLTLFTGIACVFLFIFERSISTLLLKQHNIPYLKYLLIYLFFSVPANLIEYIYLLKRKNRNIITYGIVSFVLMLLLVSLPVVGGFGIKYSLIGLIAVSVFRYVWLWVLLINHSILKLSLDFIRQHLNNAFPLILSMVLAGSAQYIDGFIVTSYFDEATFAIFRYGAREFPLVLLLANAFSSAMLPGFSNSDKLNYNLDKIKAYSLRLGSWLFPVSALMMAFTHAAFPIVFNAHFKESATIFNIYLLLIVSRLLFPQTILIGLKKTQWIMRASFWEIIVNVSFSLWFVRFWGIAGIAYGTIVAFVFEKLLLMIFVKRSCGIKPSAYLNLGRHLIYSVALTIEFIFIEYLIY